MQAVKAVDAETETFEGKKVKVALINSGVNYTEDVD